MQDAAGLCQPCRGSPETLRAAVCGHWERARGPAPWAVAGLQLPPRCLPAPACSPGRGALTAPRVRPVNHPAPEAGSPSSMTQLPCRRQLEPCGSPARALPSSCQPSWF